jgi:DNA-binding LacI/PurR family transcriptional regulator
MPSVPPTRPRRVTLRDVAQALPHYELGRRVVRLLLADDLGTRTILVPMPVRERESVPSPADRVATGGRA